MALTGHILLGNHTVNHTKGLALASAFGHGPDLHLKNLVLQHMEDTLLELPVGAASQSSPT
jgi:hypothetical protein